QLVNDENILFRGEHCGAPFANLDATKFVDVVCAQSDFFMGRYYYFMLGVGFQSTFFMGAVGNHTTDGAVVRYAAFADRPEMIVNAPGVEFGRRGVHDLCVVIKRDITVMSKCLQAVGKYIGAIGQWTRCGMSGCRCQGQGNAGSEG